MASAAPSGPGKPGTTTKKDNYKLHQSHLGIELSFKWRVKGGQHGSQISERFQKVPLLIGNAIYINKRKEKGLFFPPLISPQL